MVASEKSCGRLPVPPAAWIHHIHTAGGANGSTMMILLSCCCAFCAVVCAFCAVSSGCHLLWYVDKYERITLGRVIDETKCPTQACTIPTMVSGPRGTPGCLPASIPWFLEILFTLIAMITPVLAPVGWSNINKVTCLFPPSVALQGSQYQMTDGPLQGGHRCWKICHCHHHN